MIQHFKSSLDFGDDSISISLFCRYVIMFTSAAKSILRRLTMNGYKVLYFRELIPIQI